MSSETDDDITTLQQVWLEQARLNARAGIDTADLGRRLRQAERDGDESKLAELRLLAGRWLKNYLDALSAECHELQDTLHWKHWYKEARQGRQHQLHDLQNARVEAVDMLFFWVSICQLLGLSPTDVMRLYSKKLAVNHRRQDENRSQSQHGDHEHENRSVV